MGVVAWATLIVTLDHLRLGLCGGDLLYLNVSVVGFLKDSRLKRKKKTEEIGGGDEKWQTSERLIFIFISGWAYRDTIPERQFTGPNITTSTQHNDEKDQQETTRPKHPKPLTSILSLDFPGSDLGSANPECGNLALITA